MAHPLYYIDNNYDSIGRWGIINIKYAIQQHKYAECLVIPRVSAFKNAPLPK